MENNSYPQPNDYNFILQQDNAPQQAPKSSRKRLLIIISAVAFLLLAGALLFTMTNTSGDNTQEVTSQPFTLQQFKDPRFTAQIPATWVTTSGYEPGKGEVQFVGQAAGLASETTLDNREIFLTFNVMPAYLAKPLPENPLASDTFSKDGINYSIRSVVADAPEAISTTLLHAEKDGLVIVGTLSLPQSYFDLYKDRIYQVLASVTFNN